MNLSKPITLTQAYLDDAFERSEEVAPGTAPLLFSAMVAKSSSVESDTMDEVVVVVVLLLRNASEKNSPSASSQVWPTSPPDEPIFSYFQELDVTFIHYFVAKYASLCVKGRTQRSK